MLASIFTLTMFVLFGVLLSILIAKCVMQIENCFTFVPVALETMNKVKTEMHMTVQKLLPGSG